MDHFGCSLREYVRWELACRDTTLLLDELIDMSIRLDNLLAARGCLEWALLIPSHSPSCSHPHGVRGGCIEGDRRSFLLHQLWSARTHGRPVLEELVW